MRAEPKGAGDELQETRGVEIRVDGVHTKITQLQVDEPQGDGEGSQRPEDEVTAGDVDHTIGSPKPQVATSRNEEERTGGEVIRAHAQWIAQPWRRANRGRGDSCSGTMDRTTLGRERPTPQGKTAVNAVKCERVNTDSARHTSPSHGPELTSAVSSRPPPAGAHARPPGHFIRHDIQPKPARSFYTQPPKRSKPPHKRNGGKLPHKKSPTLLVRRETMTRGHASQTRVACTLL